MSRINITQEGPRWVARFSFDYTTKDTVKSAGFRFDPAKKLWWTDDPQAAAKLTSDAGDKAIASVAQSRAVTADTAIPCPQGLAYRPFQIAGISYALGRDSVLIGDEMGLGKTVQAVGIINADPSIRSVLVVCPASLKRNWELELHRWLVEPRKVAIANGSFPAADIVIINYDVLVKHRAAIDARKWDLLIGDEIHYAKNDKAQRTRAMLGKWSRDPDSRVPGIVARKRVFLTGTPVVNRPKELWTLVAALDPADMGRNRMAFMKRYTNAHFNGYGYDFDGAANLDELQRRMRAKFMVRRLKSEVLTELPPKQRQVIVLQPTDGALAAVEAEKAAHARVEAAKAAVARAQKAGDRAAYEAAVRALRDTEEVAFSEMSRLRHDTAVAKIPHVIDHVEQCLEGSEGKLVVFCHHHDVAHALRDAFPGAAIVTGETPVARRQLEVERFQNDASCRVFIGGIQAAGVGLTLTASSHVIFSELDWVPGNVSQAEDRCHRIGQHDSVLVQHLVFNDSIDARMANVIIEKQAVIDQALDRRPAPVAAVTAGRMVDGRIPNDLTIPF